MFELVAAATAFAGLLIFVRLVGSARKRRREQTDDEVDFDDWKKGSPNDPLPPGAVPVKQTGIKDESS